MSTRKTNPFASGYLAVVASLSDRVIDASLVELKRRDDLARGMREAHRLGVSVSDLSAASGLTVAEIRKLIKREPLFGEDLDSLAGTR